VQGSGLNIYYINQ